MTYLNYPTAFLPPVGAAVRRTTTAALSPYSVTEPIHSLASSSGELIAAAGTAEMMQGSSSSSSQVFEAVAPDTSLLVGMGFVVAICIVAGFVWANEVVPVSRTKLAISKSRGEVREYLDELKTYNETSVEGLNATNMLSEDDPSDRASELVKPNVGDGRDFERWLFSDWLNKPDAKGGRQKEPALPILKEAKWNSGDNPVLVTAAIMMLGVVLASVTERIAS